MAQRIAKGALKRVSIDQQARDGFYVNFVYRRQGLLHMLRTLLRRDPTGYLQLSNHEVRIKELSLWREFHHTVPLRSVRAVVAEYRRPFWSLMLGVLFGAAGAAVLTIGLTEQTGPLADDLDSEVGDFVRDLGDSGAVGWGAGLVIFGALLLARYAYRKYLELSFEYTGTRASKVRLSRSMGVGISTDQVRQAIDLANSVIVRAGEHRPGEESAFPPPADRAEPTPDSGERLEPS